MKILALIIACLTIITVSSEKYFARVYCTEVKASAAINIARFNAIHRAPTPTQEDSKSPMLQRPSVEIIPDKTVKRLSRAKNSQSKI